MYSATFKGPMLSMAICEIKVAGVRQVGFTKIDIEDGVKAEAEMGSGPIPLGSAIGTWEGTLSCDQHLQEALALKKFLNERSGGVGFALVETNLSLTFVNPVKIQGLDLGIKEIVAEGVRWLKTKPALSNDGKSVIASWTTLLTKPVGFGPGDGTLVYSMNPDVFAESNSLSIGLGGVVNLGG